MPVTPVGKLLTGALYTVMAKQDLARLVDVDKDLAPQLQAFMPRATHNTVKSWRVGATTLDPQRASVLALIAAYCINNGYVSHRWLMSLLDALGLSDEDIAIVVTRVHSSLTTEGGKLPPPLPIINTLRRRARPLVGRDPEKQLIVKALQEGWRVVSIEGLVGVGKTVLAEEIASECLVNHHPKPLVEPPFEAAIGLSLAALPAGEGTQLQRLLRQIATMLDLRPPPERLLLGIHAYLSKSRVLLVFDDCDAITDHELAHWMYSIPTPSQILATTSKHTSFQHTPFKDPSGQVKVIPIRGLQRGDALTVIRQHADSDMPGVARWEEAVLIELIDAVGGNVKAIELILGHADEEGCPLEEMVTQLRSATPDTESLFPHFFQQLFTDWFWPALTEHCQQVLLANSFFAAPVGASKEALRAAAGLHQPQFNQCLQELINRQLVDVLLAPGAPRGSAPRYPLHSLVHTFARQQLHAHRDPPSPARERFHQTALERWANWYLNFVYDHGSLDAASWTARYATLDAEWDNLLLVFKWCKEHHRLDLLRGFWSYEGIRQFANLYPHWDAR